VSFILLSFFITGCVKKFPDNNALLLLLLDFANNSTTPTTPPTTPPPVVGTIYSASSIVVTENQTVTSFTVALGTAVEAGQTVDIPVTGVGTEGLISTTSAAGPFVAGPIILTFDDINWNTPQTVWVQGVDDGISPDATTYTQFTITLGAVTTADPNYTGFDPPDMTAYSLDNDLGAVTPAIITVPASGLSTSEPNLPVNFGIVLNSQPPLGETITISLVSDDTSEGTISPATMTFDSTNWFTPQTATVTGADDPFVDVNTAYTTTLTSSSTNTLSLFHGMSYTVNLTNVDNDSAGVTLSTNSIITSETPTSQNVTVSLSAAPATGSQVQIDIFVTNPLEGLLTTPASIIFTDIAPGPQNITIQGVDDANADGDVTYPVTFAINLIGTTDPAYTAVPMPTLNVTNTDNEVPGINVTPVTAGTLPEDGTTTATFDVVLNTQPLSPVTVNVFSSDTTEASVNVATLTFEPTIGCPGTGNCWDNPHTVTITGVDDLLADGAQNWTIVTATATSADSAYNGINPADVTGSTSDDDTAGITVWDPNSAGFSIIEQGGTDLITIRLNSQPDGNVVIPYSYTSILPGTHELVYINYILSPNSGNLTFTPSNWFVNQTILMRSVADTTMDRAAAAGDPVFTVSVGPVSGTSTDTTGYIGLTVTGSPFAGVNIEDEKYMFTSAGTHHGGFDLDAGLAGGIYSATNNDFNGLDEADNFCMIDAVYPGGSAGNYKALLSSPAVRVGSVTANVGDGQKDWVFKPSTTYYRVEDSALIGTTGANSLFTFPLSGGFSSAAPAVGVWTGTNTDWTTAGGPGGIACGIAWDINAAGPIGGGTFSPQLTTSAAIYTGPAGCNSNTVQILCVEQ
ncbi:MAG: DUF1554 domain-containing protein, partial [Spirochaetia bacterium]|nr:DUF1554 domain-containing protein [Spirochaetia bacterium]